MIKVFNTLSEKKEFLPTRRPLRIFVCGPTVYDDPHIGHARTYIAFDTIVKYLKSRKIRTFYLQNITDVDDKIITRASEQKVSPLKLAKEFEKKYYQFEKSLGIKIDRHAPATKYIPQIIKQVKVLIKKGFAYKIEGDGYYFDVTKFRDYGKLSRRTVIQAEDAVSRIDENIQKKNKGDFALWKFKKRENEPSWKTELGEGRPGWHIEDTAITEYHFGPQYEIHGGGIDLKFPHHEAEIAQQESASGRKPLARIWMHTGALLINGQKMSKSLKNFITARDFLKQYSPETLRLMILMNHYRSPFDFKNEIAENTQNTYSRVQNFIYRLSSVKSKSGKLNAAEFLKIAKKKFRSAMEDDFNTPKALAAIFELINKTEINIKQINLTNAKKIAGFIIKTAAFLGLRLTKKLKIPKEIEGKVKRRQLLRVHKQFIQADVLRKEIEALGYIIEDMPSGPLILAK